MKYKKIKQSLTNRRIKCKYSSCPRIGGIRRLEGWGFQRVKTTDKIIKRKMNYFDYVKIKNLYKTDAIKKIKGK